LAELLQIVFVGNERFREVRSGLLLGLKHALVRPSVVYKLLEIYCNLNREYKDINIDKTVSFASNATQLLPDQFKEVRTTKEENDAKSSENHSSFIAQVIGNAVTVKIEELTEMNRTGNDVAGVRDHVDTAATTEADFKPDDDANLMQHVFPTAHANAGSPTGSIDPTNALDGARTGKNGGEHNNDAVWSRSLICSASGLPRNQTVAELRMNRLQSLKETVKVDQLPIAIRAGDDKPYNEFTENDKLMRHCFPHLFLMGSGGGRKGTLQPDYVEHLNNQFTGKFAKDIEFQMLVFDQMQRHKVARVVKQ
jgi:hypothetical protein